MYFVQVINGSCVMLQLTVRLWICVLNQTSTFISCVILTKLTYFVSVFSSIKQETL